MRRFLSCILILPVLFALAVPAYADIVWEPMDNSFYNRHSGQCEYESRAYYANGRDGFVTLWDAPGGTVVRAQYENGEKLWVYYLYNGSWALIGRWENHEELSGWVPLADLALAYDWQCFEEDYADRIKPYSGEFADFDRELAVINFYEYPGAPSIDTVFKTEGQESALENLTGRGDNSSCLRNVFVDEDGRTWGFLGYLYGIRNVWFCLDEPDGEDFPIREVPDPDLIPAQTPSLPAKGYAPYALVAAATAVTGGLLAVFYGGRNKKKDSSNQ